MEIDRRAFIASLGGAAAINSMSPEMLADELEHHMLDLLDGEAQGLPVQTGPPPQSRRGVGDLFRAPGPVNGELRTLPQLAPMPKNPTLVDYFNLRFAPANHVLQSATRALKEGMPERTILACLLHDVVLNLIKVDHGWWGAQMLEPYVDERISWGIRYHQALRFYPDKEAGYEYPELYDRIFGKGYVPEPHIQEAYKFARNHKWYMEARLITVNDLYAFDPKATVSLDPFVDIIGRHFKTPKEGLGFDNSPVAHMWRTIARPDMPL
jgi:hypothetical protein